MEKKLEFEIMAMDSAGVCHLKTEAQVSYSLMSNSLICHDSSKLNSEKDEVSFGSIRIKIQQIKSEEGAGFSRALLIKAIGNKDELEPLRENIVAHLQHQKLLPIYILKDEISEYIACKLYPELYKVENLLRGYLIKFMATRLGPKWWEATATNEATKKAIQRKNNEKTFSQYVDNNAYLIDFSDLGKMIYEQSSGFNSKSDVIRKIIECDENIESLKKLKNELQSNYQKFFKEHFKDNGFQGKWEELQYLRNKIAHNGLFTYSELEEGHSLINDLIEIIRKALEEIPKVEIEESEKDAIKATFVSKGWSYNVITEDEFLKQLSEIEDYYDSTNGFVGLANFVKNHLGSQGYSYQTSYDVVNQLETKGLIELYKVENLDGEYPVTAIKSHS